MYMKVRKSAGRQAVPDVPQRHPNLLEASTVHSSWPQGCGIFALIKRCLWDDESMIRSSTLMEFATLTLNPATKQPKARIYKPAEVDALLVEQGLAKKDEDSEIDASCITEHLMDMVIVHDVGIVLPTNLGMHTPTVFLSIFLMLMFMTYNAYLILAVVVGEAAGHFIFGSRMDLTADCPAL
ncbi:uncharacterized protein FIBRA_08083 [Fibroporia radiculosa]|uniref:Copper transport protein n=1 Tax=Fibroporia radiculosa TaxID=599839 RepID=J4I238_9APHY|nr:uncharacterized protein FIBRA_08083 [Fibroporia radiculosa]CCM05847.1 predicted protein [Fibroporia radiculosa]